VAADHDDVAGRSMNAVWIIVGVALSIVGLCAVVAVSALRIAKSINEETGKP
jgi:flagellar biosynthesis protein FliQ